MAKNNNKSCKAQVRNRKSRNTTGRYQSKGTERSKDMEELKQLDAYQKNNHPSWYNPNNVLFEGATRLPANYRTGDKMNFTIGGAFSESSSQEYLINGWFNMPGILTLDCSNLLGVSTDKTSPLNQAAVNIYSWIRHANSGAKNYDPADLMLYLAAMDSVYTAIAWCRRAIGLAGSYSTTNKYTPTGVFEAMGVNFDDLIANRIRYIDELNNIIINASTLPVPAVMPLFYRHVWMYSNVYTDASNPWCQLYMYNLANVYEFGIDEDGLGYLETSMWYDERKPTLGHYFNKLQSMLESIRIQIDDIGTIGGDILKAYGDANCIKIDMCPLDYAIIPLYDEDVLEQIHNATVVGSPYNDTLDVHQVVKEGSNTVDGYLVCKPQFQFGDITTEHAPGFGIRDTILDFHHEIDSDRIMRASRLTAAGGKAWKLSSGNTGIWEPAVIGTEVVNKMRMLNYEYTSDATKAGTYQTTSWDRNIIRSANVSTLPGLLDLSTFNYAPLMWHAETSFNDLTPAQVRLMGNLDRIMIVKQTDLEQLHFVALQGLYNIPNLILGKSSNA